MAASAYQPNEPARRPGGRPSEGPKWRVLVHRHYAQQYSEMISRVGIAAAQELWDYLANDPDKPPRTGSATILKGSAGKPKGPGWSRVVHYDLSSKARVNFHYAAKFRTTSDGDEHPVVAILSINYGSH